MSHHDRSADWSWPLWPIVPLYPYGQRRTLCQEIVSNRIWTFEQLQGILYVVVPIRMTVVRLERGGLLVYAPVAPTLECLGLLQELIDNHGPVEYIVLPTASGIEHKVFVGPFARQFPQAQVFVTANQWSFPLNLPLSWLGLPGNRTQVLPPQSQAAPFGDEFDYAVLGPIQLGLGCFEEMALFHRQSKTLLLTDSIVSISPEPPPILEQQPYPLLFHAREDVAEEVANTVSNRRKGWQRITLFAFFFRPTALDVLGLGTILANVRKAADRSNSAYYGFLPWHWRDGDWQRSFDQLWGKGRLFVAPILQTLIFDRQPEAVLTWADTVAEWPFQRIIPCHLTAPLQVGPKQFRQAFNFLSDSPGPGPQAPYPLPPEDFGLLQQFSKILVQTRITPPPRR
jgi:hypothetical protein